MSAPLCAADLESLLDTLLETEYSYRNVVPAAEALAQLNAADQGYILEWTERVASTHIELGYQYATQVAAVIAQVERSLLEGWVLHAMDLYDREGLRPAKLVMEDLDHFLHHHHACRCGAILEQHEGVLERFVCGLSGRRLRIGSDQQAWSDSETLFLPPLIAELETPRDNFLLYKATIAQLWAQTRYGTFRMVSQLLPQSAEFIALFHALESLRLERRIAQEMPGLWREIERLAQQLLSAEQQQAWQPLRRHLATSGAESHHILALTQRLAPHHTAPPPLPWHGVLQPEPTAARMAARIERERLLLKVRLHQLQQESEPQATPRKQGGGFTLRPPTPPDPEAATLEPPELLLDGRPLPLPDEVRETLSSILLDLGEIPDHYLEPAGPGSYDPRLFGEEEPDSSSAWSGTYHEQGALLYPEWDYRRKSYRKGWCAVREVELEPGDADFRALTLTKYHGLVKQLRRTFEAMRDAERRLKRQSHGDEIDLDALVAALADARDGREMSDRMFTRNQRYERNIAVIFMVDMSGSTRGWINQAERESLILLCEALERLGDRYAIYGFSSITRKRCELYPVKRLHEPYSELIQRRIAAIDARDYTRMGFAIRHLTHLLTAVDARTRILITLSDGKPDDYDNYRGDYGIEDTRRALIESRRAGIHPYCITIDHEARDYLSHLYGPAAWTLVDQVAALPLKVSDIYRRLTW